MKFLTFVHRSPFATWNSLQAWIREAGEVPEQVVICHTPRVKEHARTVAAGTCDVLDHYGAARAEERVRLTSVATNDVTTWRGALEKELGQEGPWAVDVTPSRTIAKLAAAAVVQNHADAHLFYLDVADYRYEAKPFPWVPYNLQNLWHFTGPKGDKPRHAGARGLRPSPGARSLANTPGLVRVDAAGHRETVVPWQALLVLLNEAAADQASGRSGQHPAFMVKLPAFGVDVGQYDLVSRRFRLQPYREIALAVEKATGRVDDPWKREVPRADHVLECLATARMLPYKDQPRLMDELHEMAAATRGPNPGVAPRALALDTNLFYFDFVTSLARAAGLPTIRVPVVASSVTRSEIRHQMKKRFPAGPLPPLVQQAEVRRPLVARLAHAAHEEFELLRTRCRMDVITGPDATRSNDENDRLILMDFAAHRDREQQELLVLSNDRGFVDRSTQDARGLDVRHVDFEDPDAKTSATVNVDQMAYLVYRLAMGFGRVSLKGLSVEVMGEPREADPKSYLHEKVRLRVPDAPWTASFLHELALRERLDARVRQARLWLP